MTGPTRCPCCGATVGPIPIEDFDCPRLARLVRAIVTDLTYEEDPCETS